LQDLLLYGILHLALREIDWTQSYKAVIWTFQRDRRQRMPTKLLVPNAVGHLVETLMLFWHSAG
jgi:hypothetical protein